MKFHTAIDRNLDYLDLEWIKRHSEMWTKLNINVLGWFRESVQKYF